MRTYFIFSIALVVASTFWYSCSDDKSPLPSTAHPESWSQTESREFHGKKVLAAGFSSCTSCHGTDFSGGESQVSCFTCHQSFPHQDAWLEISNPDFHGEFIRNDKWSMVSCQKCHGSDYRGGSSEASCYTCHKDEGGPQACNVCHGSQDNFAPPEDLENNVATTNLGVGAHQLHLKLFNDCSICHTVPANVSDAGHIDDSPHAEVKDSWGWNRESATCANACHSDQNKTYIWNNF